MPRHDKAARVLPFAEAAGGHGRLGGRSGRLTAHDAPQDESPPTHPSSHDAPQRTSASDPHHP
ncbi:hypothetical protein ABZ566_28610, partial [Streptomyces hygroscopicus]